MVLWMGTRNGLNRLMEVKSKFITTRSERMADLGHNVPSGNGGRQLAQYGYYI
jgi:hypothetical protein